ncbi:NAD(P)H-hydrate dehydratase, partial [Candidatus Curtissbacteria bacterium]|nr:NAD(P)H-hydrate dehydratase [Candidatus Curtissbacteria bacterium]
VHKGAYGSVLVLCGSTLYSGSATLAAVSAVRAGADVVTVASAERAANVAAGTLPDLITLPLKGSHLTSSHVADIMDVVHVRRVNSVVIGCGLGVHQGTLLAINKLIQKFTVPLVIDADGLRAIAKNPGVVSTKHSVLTPHLGELAILLGEEKINDDFDSRLLAAKQAAAKFKSVVLLKGNVDIITDGSISITNNSGTPYMTKGGFGDTLSGICGALLARGVGLIEAANAAAYINGRAGELASEKTGEGVAASDIFEEIPRVISG